MQRMLAIDLEREHGDWISYSIRDKNQPFLTDTSRGNTSDEGSDYVYSALSFESCSESSLCGEPRFPREIPVNEVLATACGHVK